MLPAKRRRNRSPEARRRRNARRNGFSNPDAPPMEWCSCLIAYSGRELRCPRCRGLNPYVPCSECRYEPDGRMAASGLTASPRGGVGASARRGGERGKAVVEAELVTCPTCHGKGRVLISDNERNAA